MRFGLDPRLDHRANSLWSPVSVLGTHVFARLRGATCPASRPKCLSRYVGQPQLWTGRRTASLHRIPGARERGAGYVKSSVTLLLEQGYWCAPRGSILRAGLERCPECGLTVTTLREKDREVMGKDYFSPSTSDMLIFWCGYCLLDLMPQPRESKVPTAIVV